VPDAVTAAPPIRSLVWSLLGAVVALWLAYAIVAGMKHGTAAPRPASHARPAAQTAPVGLSLTAPPALRVRSSLFAPGRAAPVIRHAPRQRASAKSASTPAPQTAMTPAPAPATTPAVTPVQATPTPTSTPAPQPAAKPRPQTTLKPQPKQSSGPGFDESSASGFDQSG
jgi:hypothetical protein